VKINPENPARLRECLTALAAAAGADATRCELFVDSESVVIVVTSSREASEEAIADAIVKCLINEAQP
jgi:hypothetical protein